MLHFFFTFLCCTSNEPNLPIDIAFINGSIYTEEGTTDTLYIRAGEVVSQTQPPSQILRTVDLQGRTIIPSFHDSHTHLLAGSFVSDKLLLVGAMSMTSIQSKVADYVASEPDVPWVVGYGWIKSSIDNPTGLSLDAVSEDYPVALFDSAGHSLLVNSKAMELAGIDATTVPPNGGIIHVDEDGNPTGFLQEGAIELISPLMVSQFSDTQLSANLESQISEFHKSGITSVSEILAVPGVNLSRPELYHQFIDLEFRVAYYLPIFDIENLNTVEAFLDDRTDWVHFEGVKVWVDGSSGSGESWSLEESDIEDEHYGSQYFDTLEIQKLVEHAESHQYNVKLHVNGDAAVRATLDAMEQVQQERGQLTQQYLFEHAVLIDPADYDRIYNLGATVSIQPSHALVGIYGDQADHWQDGRIDRAWDFPALEDAGLNIVLGTDWPVWPTVNGLTNLQTATNGLQSRNISLNTAFQGYTSSGRHTSGLDHVGLSPGQEADFLVLSNDPFSESESQNSNADIQVGDIQIEETWVRGQRVY